MIEFDYTIFKLVNNFAGQYLWLDTLAIFFAAFFQYALSGGLIGYMLLLKDRSTRIRNFKMTALAFFSAIVSRFVFAEIIKRLVDRPRPFETHEVNKLIFYGWDDASFLSGHMAFFFALSAVIYFYNKKAGIVLFAGSLLIGLSRVFVGFHYPLDILGGMVLGFLVGWSVYKIFFKKI